MSQAALFIPRQSAAERRRFPRFPLAAPIHVVVLRAGNPAVIPGRSIEVADGGLAAVIAGDLRSGESVGLEVHLTHGESVQAKARVLEQKGPQCRLQFLGMRADSRSTLRKLSTAVVLDTPSDVEIWPPMSKEQSLPSVSLPAVAEDAEVRRRKQARKAKLTALAPLLAVLVFVVAWWSWQSGWIGADQAPATAQASSTGRVIKIPGSVMERSLLHRVDPTYPEEAVKQKTEGLVVVGATIGRDGVIKQIAPLSGPDVLARAAVDAVRWWRFQPYQINGQPTEVQTTIEVDFRLHD